jgi:hypothetical protein
MESVAEGKVLHRCQKLPGTGHRGIVEVHTEATSHRPAGLEEGPRETCELGECEWLTRPGVEELGEQVQECMLFMGYLVTSNFFNSSLKLRNRYEVENALRVSLVQRPSTK